MNTEIAYQKDMDQLLLTTQNRYNGNPETVVLDYRMDLETYVLAAQNESEHYKPEWYLNLKEEPVVQLEVSGTVFPALAKTPVGMDRLRIWPFVKSMSGQPNEILPRDTTVIVLTPMI
jgi:hypothetical protein